MALIKSIKISEVEASLLGLRDGVYRIGDIIDTILQIGNFKGKTLPKVSPTGIPPSYPDETPLVSLDDLWVDMDYQRKIQLVKLINFLKNKGGFNTRQSGTIDYAVRNDGRKFVWDGLGRCLMAGMVGMKKITFFATYHPKGTSDKDAQKIEAEDFAVRNGQVRKPKSEELFKAYVCQELPDAMKKLETLKKCDLDIEGLIPSSKTLLTGFKAFDTNYEKMTEKNWIDASDIIRTAWHDMKTVAVYGLTGIAYTLERNEYLKVPYTVKQIKSGITKWRMYKKNKKELCFQDDFFKHGFRRIDLIGYLVCTRALGEDPVTGPLVSLMGLNPDEKEMVDVAIETKIKKAA